MYILYAISTWGIKCECPCVSRSRSTYKMKVITIFGVKWNEPQAFDKLIMRPGVMHIVQNVCGCIGQLMMGSGLADLIGSAFGGVGSIMAQGKPWVRAMRSFRMVSSVLLQ